jgi:hypothetical protein
LFYVAFQRNDSQPNVTKAECSCPVGFSEACGHITGLLYQIAKYKVLNIRTLPEDVAKYHNLRHGIHPEEKRSEAKKFKIWRYLSIGSLMVKEKLLQEQSGLHFTTLYVDTNLNA